MTELIRERIGAWDTLGYRQELFARARFARRKRRGLPSGLKRKERVQLRRPLFALCASEMFQRLSVFFVQLLLLTRVLRQWLH